MEHIFNVLYWFSTGLMIPVTLFLLFFLAQSLVMIGRFYRSYTIRNKVNTRLHDLIDKDSIALLMEELSNFGIQKSLLLSTLERMKTHQLRPVMLDKILGDYETMADKELSASKLLVKIGPMLGLMGTLIPMGPALVGLAVGDVSSMANNMQVAFSTTVIGIVIGAIGFITQQSKQRWMADEMNILEYVVSSLHQK